MAYHYQSEADALKKYGGVVHRNQTVIQKRPVRTTSPQEVVETLPDEKPVQVISSNQHGVSKDFASDKTMYDLFFEQTVEAEKLRRQFEDWMIPEMRTGTTETGTHITRVASLRNFYRGKINQSNFKAEQYLYAVLNPSLNTVRSFGSFYGTDVERTSILVCAYVGNPQTGILKDSYIEYAVRLNSPWTACTQRVAREIVQGKIIDFFAIRGDAELEQAVGEKWYNERDYFFNSVIYPIAKQSMPGEP